MTLRDEWEFEYESTVVADAAGKKAEHHAERKAWWESERDNVIAQLKASGLEVTEYEVTGGQRADVQFDPKLMKRLSEAQSKITNHQRDIERYSMYNRVLHANAGKNLMLHPGDIDHFGLA